MSPWFPDKTRARLVVEGMKATSVRPTAIAAAVLMGLSCLAQVRQVDASGRAGLAAMPQSAGQVLVAQASTSGTGTSTAPASNSQPSTTEPSASQPSTSQPSTSQPSATGTSGQSGGSGDDTGGSQPGSGDQGSGDQGTGTDTGSGATASPQQPSQDITTPPPPPLNPALDAQAKLLLQQLTAKQLDPRLPATPLPDWFAQLIGKRAEIEWTTGDCSDEADFSGSGSDNGGASGASYDPTLCTEAQALFYGPDGKASLDRYVVLQLTVGSRQTGVNRVPTSYGPDGKASLDRYVVLQITVGTRQAGVNRVASTYGPDAVTIFVFDGSSTRTLSRLSELNGALESMN